jgi:PTS system mannose-specific IIA component
VIGVVVATHGDLAQALVSTVQLVARDTSHIVAVAIRQDDDANVFLERFLKAVEQARQGRQGVVILTDMFGGTPSTLGMTLFERGKVEILTGVNLPMLIKVVAQMDQDLDVITVAERARASAVQAIALASHVLAKNEPDGRVGG